MGFILYENISHSDVEIKNTFEIEELVSWDNQEAMIITNWFYRKNGDVLRGDYDERRHYVECSGEELLEVVNALDKVLDCSDKSLKDLKALHYFPIFYVVPYYVGLEMWSEKYYDCLRVLLEDLKRIIPSDSVNNRERLFYYNIRW